MLSIADRAKVEGAFDQIIDLFGTQFEHHMAKPPKTVTNVRIGFKSVGKDDTEVVNSLGMSAKIITIKVDSLGTPPAKFDRFIRPGESYTADAVHPIHLNDKIVGYKIYCKG